MKRNIYIIAYALLLSLATMAQTENTISPILPSRTATNTIGVGYLSFEDPYLSPLTYRGHQLIFSHRNSAFFAQKIDKISWWTLLQLKGGRSLNSAKSAQTMNGGLNFSGGIFRHFTPCKNLLLQIGGSGEMDFYAKYLSRNVNNPFNMDLSADFTLNGSINYLFRIWHYPITTSYRVSTPIIGLFFAPMIGASYYEIFSLGNDKSIVHFSSPHNKRAVKHSFQLVFPLKSHHLHLQVSQHYLSYKANNHIYKRNELFLTIGDAIDLYKIRPKESVINKHFKRTIF